MHIAEFLFALIAIFVAAKIFGEIAERLRQPAVLGEIVGGIVIGVSGLRLVDPHDPTIHLLAELGVILLLFLIGLETDLRRLVSVGGPATVVAFVGVALPFAGGFALASALGYPTMVAVFLGAALTATSVGITARVLSDLGHLRDQESQIILGAAVVDDIIGIILLTMLGTLSRGGELSVAGVSWIVLMAFGFVVLAIVIGNYLAPLLVRGIERMKTARALLFGAIVFAFLLAWLAHTVGSAVIIGSFAAGLVLARTNKAREIEHQVHDLAHFFIPIFFVIVGAAIDLRMLNPFRPDTRQFLIIGLALTAVGVVGKIVAGFAAWGPRIRRLVVGVGMVPRGEVGLIFAQIGLSTGLLSGGLYSAVAVMVMLTTLITLPLLRALLVQRTPDVVRGEPDYVMEAPSDK
ncbi:MAG TPA: cation:proton antiporter [Thermoanaerobaculia bacterium]|nr:cation:proton antiporter [Thermoanaerobaculia bacterium]